MTIGSLLISMTGKSLLKCFTHNLRIFYILPLIAGTIISRSLENWDIIIKRNKCLHCNVSQFYFEKETILLRVKPESRINH